MLGFELEEILFILYFLHLPQTRRFFVILCRWLILRRVSTDDRLTDFFSFLVHDCNNISLMIL